MCARQYRRPTRFLYIVFGEWIKKKVLNVHAAIHTHTHTLMLNTDSGERSRSRTSTRFFHGASFSLTTPENAPKMIHNTRMKICWDRFNDAELFCFGRVGRWLGRVFYFFWIDSSFDGLASVGRSELLAIDAFFYVQ